MAAVAHSIALIGKKASRTRGFLLREALAVSLSSLWAHKLRSSLTLIGIVIGITSIIAISSITTYAIAAAAASLIAGRASLVCYYLPLAFGRSRRRRVFISRRGFDPVLPRRVPAPLFI